jgi:Fe-S-cluster containining protein
MTITPDPDLQRRQDERWPLAMQRAQDKTRGWDPGGSWERVNGLMNAARRASTTPKRVLWMLRAGAAFSDAVGERAACRPGCAHCCVIPATITRTEADILALASGRPVARDVVTVKARGITSIEQLDAVRPGLTRWPVGTRCPFLGADDACTVYAARPLACRTLLNMDDDNLLCQHSGVGTAQVPFANHWPLTLNAMAMQPAMELGDIRDFFPPAEAISQLAN